MTTFAERIRKLSDQAPEPEAAAPATFAERVRKVTPRPASPVKDFGQQFLAGLDDIGGAITRPFRGVLPSPVFTPGQGLSLLSPEETAQQRGAGAIGTPGEVFGEPATLSGRAGRFAGQTAALAPVMGGVASLVTPAAAPAVTALGRAAQVPRNVLSAMGARFAGAPVATTAVETALGASAGAGGFIAGKVFPDSDAAVFIGDIVGGTVPSLMPATLAAKGVSAARGIIRKALHPMTATGGRGRAVARLERAAPGARSTAAERMAQPTTPDPATGRPVLTPAARSEEPGLLALERSVVESSETLLREMDGHVARANAVIQQSLRELGGPAPATAMSERIESAHAYLKDLLESRVRIAAQRADERIEQLAPSVGREHANRLAREEIESALTAARTQERELFQAVPQDALVPTSATRNALQEHIADIGRAQRGDIPIEARRFLTPGSKAFFGEETTVLELRSLQSKLRETARNARGGEKRNLNKARIADDLADVITEDLANTRGGPEAAEAIAVAVAFSRDLNGRFSRGTVGRLLGRRAAGDPRTAASLTLEEALAGGGPKARQALDDIVKAFDSPEAPDAHILTGATQDWIRGRFLATAVEQGQLNLRKAQTFLSRNEELLSRLPELRQSFNEAIAAGNAANVARRNAERVRFNDPRTSKAALFVQQGPVEAFDRIARLPAAQASRETQMLLNRAARDLTGEATEGLRAGFVEYLMTGAKTRARDVDGDTFLSGFALREAMQNPSTRLMTARLFSQDERNRLAVITRDLMRLDRQREARAGPEGILGDTSGKFLERFARIVGAGVGRALGRATGSGGTVQIPGQMSNAANELVQAGIKDPAARLISDAITNETLFRELLQEPMVAGGTQLSGRATRRLNAWVAVVLAEHGLRREEEPER